MMGTPVTPPIQRPPIQIGGICRSFTQPPRSLSFHEKAGLDPSDSAADVLYTHPHSRIVSFTPPIDAVRSVSTPASHEYDYPVDTIETLPWASTTETVLASGSLIIEKVCGSTNFLKSGSKPLHALMRNSQCWCVDDEATLVMRTGAFKYSRIELPYSTDSDKEKVQELKELLKRILRFEATPCPFKRGFHVELPDSATTPRKRGPWKRRPGSFLSPQVITPSPNLSMKKSRSSPASGNRLQGGEEDYCSPKSSANEKKDILSRKDRQQEKDQWAYQNPEEEEEDCTNSSTDNSDEDQLPLETTSTTNSTPDLLQNQNSIMHNPLLAKDLASDSSDKPLEESSSVEAATEQFDPSSVLGRQSIDSKDEEHELTNPNPLDIITDSSVPQMDPTQNRSLSRTSSTSNVGSSHHGDSVSNHIQGPKTEGAVHSTAYGQDQHFGVQQDKDDRMLNSIETSPIVEDVPAGQVDEADLEVETSYGTSDSDKRSLETSIAHDNDSSIMNEDYESLNKGDAMVSSGAQTLSHESKLQPFDAVSLSSCAGSFHSLASLGNNREDACSTELTQPTFSEAQRTQDLPSKTHRRDVSEMTVTTQESATAAEATNSPLRSPTATSEDLHTPSLRHSSASDSSWPDVETPAAISADAGLRQRLRPKRSFSPLPPESTLLIQSPHSPRRNHLTGAIMQKPVEAVVMLVHILARIVGGATFDDLIKGELFRRPRPQALEHSRPRNRPQSADVESDEASEDDDFGVPIRGRKRAGEPPKMQEDEETDLNSDLD